MDPDANREEQRRIQARIVGGNAEPGDRARLRELKQALSEWIAKGGFPPKT